MNSKRRIFERLWGEGAIMKVIGVGVGRTGTYSLKLALERLDLGPCHHM